jgi:hypothetical protein
MSSKVFRTTGSTFNRFGRMEPQAMKTFRVVIHHGTHQSKVLVSARSLEESMTQAVLILGIRKRDISRIEAKEN